MQTPSPDHETQSLRRFTSQRHIEFFQNQLAFALTMTGLLCFGLVIHLLYHPIEVSLTELRAQFLKPDWVEPETKERLQFIIFILLLVPVSLLSILWVKKKTDRVFLKDKPIKLKVWNFSCYAMPVLMIAPFIGSHFFELIIPHSMQRIWWFSPFIILPAIGWLFLRLKRPGHSRPVPKRVSKIISLILAFEILLSVLAFRVFNLKMIGEDSRWTFHFEAVFYSIAQVLGGQTLLADLPASYGLYAEVLRPIFAITGISVLKFTLIMAILQLIAIYALFWFCSRFIKLIEFRFLCVTSLCLLVGATWTMLSSGSIDPYFQYWPIRFLFPALSLPLFFYVISSEGVLSLIVCLLFCSLAVFWNLDSGIPVVGTFLAYLFLQIFFAKKRTYNFHILRFISFTTILIALLWAGLVYLRIKSGDEIDMTVVAKYQQIFFKSGYFMLPLPRSPHPWMIIFGFYCFAIVSSLFAYLRRRQTQTSEGLLFLGILGIGLFSYYQGRSHEVVLTMVAWPAVIIGFIFADRIFRAVSAQVLPPAFIWSLVPATLFGVVASIIVIAGLPISIQDEIYNRGKLFFSNESTPTIENIAFVKQMVRGDKKAVILAPHQALYFAEAGLVSAVKGPGIVETLLVADQEKLLTQLSSQLVDHLFIQGDENLKIPKIYDVLLQHYDIQQTSKNALIYFHPKKL